jgi:hypothetical protein
MSEDRLSQQYILDRTVDAIKLIGGGNSAGLFGMGVALYYFGSRPSPIPFLLKTAMLTYFVGVFVFGLAFASLYTFTIHKATSLAAPAHKRAQVLADAWYNAAKYGAFTAIMLWLLGSSLALVALVFL